MYFAHVQSRWFHIQKLFVSFVAVSLYLLVACMGIVCKKKKQYDESRCGFSSGFYNSWRLWVRWFLNEPHHDQVTCIRQWEEWSQKMEPRTQAQASAWDKMQYVIGDMIIILRDENAKQTQREIEEQAAKVQAYEKAAGEALKRAEGCAEFAKQLEVAKAVLHEVVLEEEAEAAAAQGATGPVAEPGPEPEPECEVLWWPYGPNNVKAEGQTPKEKKAKKKKAKKVEGVV